MFLAGFLNASVTDGRLSVVKLYFASASEMLGRPGAGSWRSIYFERRFVDYEQVH